MNFKRNEKYASVAFYTFLTVCASAAVIFGIANYSKLFAIINRFAVAFAPISWGIIIAYLCNPIVMFLEKKVFSFKKSQKDLRKLKRALSLICTFLIVFFAFFIIANALIPQLIASYEDLGAQLNTYIINVQTFADELVQKYSERFLGVYYGNAAALLEEYDITFNIRTILTNSYSLIQTGVNYVIDYGGKIVGGVKNIILGIIIAIYLLISKEKLCAQGKKILNAMLSRRNYLNTIRFARFTHETFGGFIIGKILDSIIIGILTFIVLAICKIPYYPLISVIVGVTNVLPFFGPFIGAIPSFFIIFIASPSKALLFLLLILIIQQLDGNVIGPAILGDTIGVDALWIVISITVCGSLFGFMGMLLGVPAFAIVYVLLKQNVEKKLKRKNHPVHTAFYRNDPPLENTIDPHLVLIDKDTPIPEPCAEDDIEDEITVQKKKAVFSFDSIKKIITSKGNKK